MLRPHFLSSRQFFFYDVGKFYELCYRELFWSLRHDILRKEFCRRHTFSTEHLLDADT